MSLYYGLCYQVHFDERSGDSCCDVVTAQEVIAQEVTASYELVFFRIKNVYKKAEKQEQAEKQAEIKKPSKSNRL